MMATSVAWDVVERGGLLPGPHLVEAKLGPSVPMADVATIASGLYVRNYVFSEDPGAVPYLRVNNVREFIPNMSSGDVVYVNADMVSSYDRVSVRAGDVVLPRTATLGRAFVVPSWLDGAVMSQHATRLRIRKGAGYCSPLVLAAYLNSSIGQEAVLARASGTTRLELTHASLGEVPVPKNLASVAAGPSDLRRVGELVDEMRQSVQDAHRACDSLVTSMGVELPSLREGFRTFSCPIDPSRFVSSALPRFHEPEMSRATAELSRAFRVARLGDLATIKRGKGTSSREYVRDGLPYLRTSSLINGGIDLFPDHFGTLATYHQHGQHLGGGDILLSIEGKVGLVALLGEDERVLIKNHIEFIRPNTNAALPPGFLAAWLGSTFVQAQIKQATVIQTTIPGMASASRGILVPVSPQDDARRGFYAAEVDRIDSLMKRSVDARSELRDLLNRLKHAVDHALARRPPSGRASS